MMQAFSYFIDPPNIVKTEIQTRPSKANATYSKVRKFILGARNKTHVTEYTVETHPEFRTLKDKSQLLDLIERENSDPRNELNIKGKV